MSDASRQSYYEIALTHRQVLAGFVLLLLGVVVAFLSGVWVGRQGALAPAEAVEAQAVDSAAASGEPSLERLDFFSRGDGAGSAEKSEAAAEAPGPEPAAGSTRGAADAEQAPPAPERDATGSSEPAAEQRSVAPATAEPAAAEPASVEPRPAAPEPSERAPAAGGLVIQVFSSNNRQQAAQVAERLQSGGYPAALSPVEVDGRTMYRVRIGPYSDRQIAEGIADQVRREYRLETWITE